MRAPKGLVDIGEGPQLEWAAVRAGAASLHSAEDVPSKEFSVSGADRKNETDSN